MSLTVFFDYTCGHSFALKELLDALGWPETIEVSWKTYSLKEHRREGVDESAFDDPELGSFSVLALALSHAARNADFPTYHRAVFDAIHKDHVELRREDLFAVAEKAGVDVTAFGKKKKKWLAEVRKEHQLAATSWRALGTPTLVLDEKTAVYLRFNREALDLRKPEDLWQHVVAAAADRAVLEIKRSV